ncbi:replication-associated recombination protein A [Falsarthrobacter nasiphocae]|uniref:ATPase n=1 Tax=Falsarthrobacter nasiphocae TaxID=189863 RepID=A0AAE4C784_9MICC|nr:replication-associated recombination protein A [Falsarthrobacter nasiphocae]MDR6892972.1 putative ATPase [Falsarthrobacter nasiphocae]
MEDLFSSGGSAPASKAPAPLAVRMRPRTADEVVGQSRLLSPGSALRRLMEGGDRASSTSVILYGPPGTGKTTLAHVIARAPGRQFVELSAITAGVKDVRRVMDEALTQRDLHGTRTILFLDEIHRFTKAQQDALLPGVENGWVTLVAATTENPSFSVIAPLLSRSLLLTLSPLTNDDVAALVDRALSDERGLGGAFSISPEAKADLVELSGQDARRALTSLEAAADVASAEGRADIGRDDVAQALQKAVVRYDKDGDQHYDVVSAFIKSMRGSDPDAALHYLARMIEAGEDPRFIARRIVIAASEEVSMADPMALQVAVSAAQAVQLIGMPEAQIVLAQAVVHIATAPKSNRSYMGLSAALADVRAGKAGLVPAHLRDSHYPGAKGLGHGKGYVYPHDEPTSVARQQYLPEGIETARYYEPGQTGAEREVAARLERIRRIQRPDEVS